MLPTVSQLKFNSFGKFITEGLIFIFSDLKIPWILFNWSSLRTAWKLYFVWKYYQITDWKKVLTLSSFWYLPAVRRKLTKYFQFSRHHKSEEFNPSILSSSIYNMCFTVIKEVKDELDSVSKMLISVRFPLSFNSSCRPIFFVFQIWCSGDKISTFGK